jgi:hypothetical protein
MTSPSAFTISPRVVEKHIASIFAKLGLVASDNDNRRVLAAIRVSGALTGRQPCAASVTSSMTLPRGAVALPQRLVGLLEPVQREAVRDQRAEPDLARRKSPSFRVATLIATDAWLGASIGVSTCRAQGRRHALTEPCRAREALTT